jgi:hypothetical protein
LANGKCWWGRLHESGKLFETPMHHKLEAFLDDYVRTALIAGDEKSPPHSATAGSARISELLRCGFSLSTRSKPD